MSCLPEAFEIEMKALFERFDRLDEWPAFTASFIQPPDQALRANPLKISPDQLADLLAEETDGDKPDRVGWSSDGFYAPACQQPGRSVWHSAGLFYIQEASAMLPAQVLDAKPGDRVLDLCAAPGGKSCRIASDLSGQGLLLANEISSDRARALLHNLERIGCTNAVITNDTPDRLANAYPDYFDRILVDAPCSGSGMFRRDPQARSSWESYGSEHCVTLQHDILAAAWAMLRPGGIMVYSTCAFSLSENEDMIRWLLARFPDAGLLPIKMVPGISAGLPLADGLDKTVRIWPHLAQGDGHFCARIRKHGQADEDIKADWLDANTAESRAAWQAFEHFCQQNLTEQAIQRFLAPDHKIRRRFVRGGCHLLPEQFSVPDQIKLVKTGLFLGKVRPLRDGRALFEPSQAFLYSLKSADLLFGLSGRADSNLVRGCLRGDTLSFEGAPVPPGRYAAVLVEYKDMSWPLGWCKAMNGGLFKNLYPKAWTRLI